LGRCPKHHGNSGLSQTAGTVSPLASTVCSSRTGSIASWWILVWAPRNRTVLKIYGLGSSRLVRELRNRGLSPRDITGVILTHLHFDHSGGSTRLDRSGVPVPTFPSATYYVQRSEWEEAINPNERSSDSYHSDDFLPLEERGQICLLDGDTEVAPGVRVRVTGGHCDGHQMVLVNYGGERVAYFGDLIPTPHHLRLPYIAAMDRSPEHTLDFKKEMLDEAERNGWLIIFSHGLQERAGYLERRNGDFNFRPVEL